ncbi:MAG: aminopeptidase P family protein [Alphaproteobacteria bacterium]|nr:aminopeptidase P family protein [Alphaproteobacteria bacterium]
MDRRDLFSGIASLTAGGLAAMYGREAEANWGMVAPGPVPPKDFDKRSLVNRPRAFEVMEREGVEGIVALNPVNVFYLGNYFSYELQKLRAIPSFAVMSRDSSKPIYLVAAGSDLQFIANADRDYPEVIPYTAPIELQKYLEKGNWTEEPQAAPAGAWPTTGGALKAKEQNWVAFGKKVNERRVPTPEWGLVRALQLLRLTKAKVAVDDMRIADILKTLGQNSVTCLPGDNTFRKIRMVKSEVELGHMRTVARINQDSVMAMLKQVKKGTTKAEIDKLFMHEAAARGAKAMWIASGTIGGLTEGAVIEGEPMMFDGVCQFNFYHGDFGRTVVLGEPSKELKAMMAAVKVGWDTVHDVLKPGMKYSELRDIVVPAQHKAYTGTSGIKFAAGPHTVGLQHTDQAYRDGLPFVVSDDHVFQEGMTLTVDLPTNLLGFGSIHCEDLIVVTKNGCEPLATADGPLVVL